MSDAQHLQSTSAAEDEFTFTDDELLGPAHPDDAPQRRTSPGKAIGRFFRRYAGFSGRSSRSEYWWLGLLNIVVIYGFAILAGVSQAASGNEEVTLVSGLLGSAVGLWVLGTLIPNIALGVRRLHDVNMSGAFILLLLFPGLGGLFMFIVSLLPANADGVRFDRRTGATL